MVNKVSIRENMDYACESQKGGIKWVKRWEQRGAKRVMEWSWNNNEEVNLLLNHSPFLLN